ncbi:uncharacterized protein LOC111319724, partial [Stylophora pistillata]|uniref:uncharacterized protein LOC111319724 n=1 Tax=Stylophora pistillata TaxID=50429 RepID=UPI000C044743
YGNFSLLDSFFTQIANEENTETNSPLPTGENSKANNKKIWIAVSLGLSGVVPIAIVVLVLRCRRNCKKETTESRRHPPEQPSESAFCSPLHDYEYVHYPCLVNGLRTPITATRTPLNERTLTRSAETSELRLPDQRLLTQTSSPTPGGTTRIRPYPSDQLDRCARVEDVDPQTEDFEYDYARVEIDPVKMRNIFRILGGNDAVDNIPNTCMEITIGDLSNTAFTPKPIVRKSSPSLSCRSDCDTCTYEIVAERKSGCCLRGNECLKPQNLRPPASYESLSGSRPEEYEEMGKRRSVMMVEDHESAEIEEDNGHEYYVFKAVAESDEGTGSSFSGLSILKS